MGPFQPKLVFVSINLLNCLFTTICFMVDWLYRALVNSMECKFFPPPSSHSLLFVFCSPHTITTRLPHPPLEPLLPWSSFSTNAQRRQVYPTHSSVSPSLPASSSNRTNRVRLTPGALQCFVLSNRVLEDHIPPPHLRPLETRPKG